MILLEELIHELFHVVSLIYKSLTKFNLLKGLSHDIYGSRKVRSPNIYASQQFTILSMWESLTCELFLTQNQYQIKSNQYFIIDHNQPKSIQINTKSKQNQ